MTKSAVLTFALAAVSTACSMSKPASPPPTHPNGHTPAPKTTAPPAPAPPQIANPAAQHCLDKGGRLAVRQVDGGEASFCIFPNGSECEAWAFFRGECRPKP